MAITLTAVQPRDGAVDVPLNSEVVFRMVNTVVINLSNLGVIIDDGDTVDNAIVAGVFSNGYDGEYIDNSGGLGIDITVVIIRPTVNPEYPQGRMVSVGVDVS